MLCAAALLQRDSSTSSNGRETKWFLMTILDRRTKARYLGVVTVLSNRVYLRMFVYAHYILRERMLSLSVFCELLSTNFEHRTTEVPEYTLIVNACHEADAFAARKYKRCRPCTGHSEHFRRTFAVVDLIRRA